MTLVLTPSASLQQKLQNQQIQWLQSQEAQHQDIRPLRIGILNIMPSGQNYEFNLLHPLGLSLIQIEPIWIRLNSHAYKSSNREHIDQLYMSYEEATRTPLDGLIVTGAPVETIHFEEVRYWEEIRTILLHSRQNISSTLGICWGAFALAYLEGINKFNYEQKLFGIFEMKNLDFSHPVTGALDDVFLCPQSRHAGIEDHELEAAQKEGKLKLLAYGKESGYGIFETPDHRFIMHNGHPEYNASRIVFEAQRDMQRGDVPSPQHLDLEHPINCWRGHRNTFFTQWIKYCHTQIQ